MMAAFFAFFSHLYLLVIVVCGIVWQLSPDMGRQIAKRGAVSVLLFMASVMLLPAPGNGLLLGGIRFLLAVVCAVSAVLYPFTPEQVLRPWQALVLFMGLAALWSAPEGRLIIVCLLFGATVLVGLAKRQ